MFHAHRASSVALDTTVVRNFLTAGYPAQLMQYLPHAVAVGDVIGELTVQARSRPALASIIKSWPTPLSVLPKALIDRGLSIQGLWLEVGEEGNAHLGEIYTVLGAHHFKIPLIVTDDRKGKALAAEREFGIPALTTGELACEMAVKGKLHEKSAWAIYRASTRMPNQAKFDELLNTAKTAPPTPFP